MSAGSVQSGLEEPKERTIHLPSVDTNCYVALRTLDMGKYEDCLAKLSKTKAWNDLKRILLPVAEFVVKDALGQHFVDSVRRRFDAVMIFASEGKKGTPFLGQIMTTGGCGNFDVLKMLLAVGMDPDQAEHDEWRPSHYCGFLARVDLADLIYPCRPCMAAKCDRGFTPLQAASSSVSYKRDADKPDRKACREDVENYIKNGGFEAGFPTLAKLAVRKQWFAVKNLLRRQVVAEAEFTETIGGKTAAEWAEYHEELGIAKEIRYYAKAVATRFEETASQMTALAEKFCATEDEASHLKIEVKKLRVEAVAKDAKIEELSETVTMFRARLEEAGIECIRKDAVCSKSRVERGQPSVDEGCDLESGQASGSSVS